jgi:lipopolysaccharide export system protein LptA
VSQALDVSLAPGMSSIEDAHFLRGVKFEDGSMTATSAEARYEIGPGVLGLVGSQAGAAPRVDNDHIAVDATEIAITLNGPLVKADGTVKSTLKAQKKGAGTPGETKMPSLLKQDQDVTVTAGTLDYDGKTSKASYGGDAMLYQGETTIKGQTIVIDDKDGGLTAAGSDRPVVTSMVREQVNKEKKTERVNSTATAKNLEYQDDGHRLTYSGDAHLSGPDGDMTAAKIELYLRPSGDEIDRVESYDAVTLKEQSGRKTTGNRLTYLSAAEQYVVSGTPVVVLDPCGRETKGRTLTMFKATDRIVVDGNEQTRTQTKAGSNCP